MGDLFQWDREGFFEEVVFELILRYWRNVSISYWEDESWWVKEKGGCV